MKSNPDKAAWARRYRMALSRFLGAGASSPAAAEKLGCQAAALGLETLAVAGIHKRTLKTLLAQECHPGHTRPATIKKAENFFRETIVPIEATHPAARKAGAQIVHLDRALQRRAGELSDSSGRLKRASSQRKAAEARNVKYEDRHDELLNNALHMQNVLRDRMREMLSQQESERKRIGGGLRNDIAQALLAIDIHLTMLITTEKSNAGRIENTIAEAKQILLKFNKAEAVSDDRQDFL